jgi:hypothetical protein
MSSKDHSPAVQRTPRSQNLLKEIFEADSPELFAQNLPVQTVHLLIQHQGIESSSELLTLCSSYQYKLLLDFELWQNDVFDEDSLWRWIEAIDEDSSLDPITRLLDLIDPYLLALIIARHTEIMFFEEPTDRPPDQPYYTPDKGHTWVRIKIADPQLHKMMGKLLAVLFENTPDFFYKLAAMPNVSTNTELEETSYAAKSKRLAAEDIPDSETAWELHRPLRPEVAAQAIAQNGSLPTGSAINAVQPLAYDGALPNPLSQLVQEVAFRGEAKDREEFEKQLTHIANAAIVRFSVPLNDAEEISLLISKIRGTINIGLESALGLGDSTIRAIYDCLHLTGLYKLGLHKTNLLRQTVLKLSKDDCEAAEKDQALCLLLSSASAQFPELPEFFKNELDLEGTATELSTRRSPLEYTAEIDAIYEILDEHFGISPA